MRWGAMIAVLCISGWVASGAWAESATGTAKPDTGLWNTSFDQACAQARKTSQPVLAVFIGSDWCPWSMKMKREILDTKEFQTWAGRNVVLLEVDFPRQREQDETTRTANRALAKKYGVEGFPTVLFLTSDGMTFGRLGYAPDGANAWIDEAQKIIDGQKEQARAK